jgi:hypothetical protein
MLLEFLHPYYVHLKYIHLHLGSAWELHLLLGTLMMKWVTSVDWT